VVVAYKAPVDARLPLGTDLDPDQPPEAVQEVAFVVDQFRFVEPPYAREYDPAVSVTVGAAVAVMLTVRETTGEVPPGPVHCML
jgi:hypothetical protein